MWLDLYWFVLLLMAYVFWPCWLALLRQWRLKVEEGRSDARSAGAVSVIVPARNEQDALERCLASLAGQDYPDLEVIVVDDRSEDATAEIARRFSAGDSRFRYVRVEQLPEGWLGKNHAAYVGSTAARGDFLLFTDADVVFEPSAIRKAVTYMLRRRLDHLTLLPGSPPLPLWESAVMVYFAALFVSVTRAPITRFSRWGYAGVGAFNLVRRAAYEAIGGHRSLRLEVVDDVMLGWLLKKHGYRQDAVPAVDLVQVRWQKGVWGIVRGLEKNAFAGLGYSLVRVVASTLFQLGAFVAPWVALAAYGFQWPLAVTVALALVTFCGVAVRFTGSALPGLLYPVGAVVLVVAVCWSCWKAVTRGAVEWRCTCYRLDELRAFRRALERTVRCAAM